MKKDLQVSFGLESSTFSFKKYVIGQHAKVREEVTKTTLIEEIIL